MSKRVLSFIMAGTVSVLCGAGVLAQQRATEPVYRFDPALSIEGPRLPMPSAGSSVVIEKDDRDASLRLQTESPISPYLDAGRGPELSAEELRLLTEGKERGSLEDYHLEAGIGLHVEDKASLSLGYRFSSPPSLIDERRNDPLSLTGDLRISFDIKVPF